MEYNNKNFKIHGYPIKKFKTVNIRVSFITNVTKKDFILSELLLNMLVYTNNKYHTNREYNMALQDLYDLFISCHSTRYGNKLISNIELNMIDPKYTSKKVLRDSIKLLKESIFNPYVYDNHFDINSFNIVKEQLNTYINNIMELPQNMVIEKTLSAYKDTYLEDTLLGSKEYLDEIDEYKLYDYYKEFLNNREIDIYVCCDHPNDVIDLLSKLPFKSKEINYKEEHHDYKVLKPTYLYDNYNQAKLGLLLKYNNINEFEKKYVAPILCTILGGLQDSLLMETVREQESLVYYIESIIYKHDQVILVYSGFASENSEKVLKKIDDAIKRLAKGDFNDSLFNAAITDALVFFDDSERTPYLIMNLMMSYYHLSHDTIEEKIRNYKKITKKDVMELAKKLKTINIVLLRDKNERV